MNPRALLIGVALSVPLWVGLALLVWLCMRSPAPPPVPPEVLKVTPHTVKW